MARPTKLTPEFEQKFLNFIRDGNYREVAAQACGVSPQTVSRWMHEAENEEFREAVLEAETVAETKLVALAMMAAEKDGRFIWEFLERKFPQRWRKKQEISVTAKQKQPGEMTDAELLAEHAQQIDPSTAGDSPSSEGSEVSP